MSPLYDEIGYWSEVKLEIIKKYASAYSTIMSRQTIIRKHIYVDAFSGSGEHISKRSHGFVPGSPLNALNVLPPFKEFHFIDLHGGKAQALRKLVGQRDDVRIHEGDANKVLLEDVFPRCSYEDFHRGLCLLDPYALNVEWKVLQTAGQMRTIEVFYNFMIMDANMNVLWRNPDRVDASQVERMDKVWGDHSWRDAAYVGKPTLWAETFEEKARNKEVAEAFQKRLKEGAGFKYVPSPMPMRNDRGAVIYYLYFASANKTGADIVEDIFRSYGQKGTK